MTTTRTTTCPACGSDNNTITRDPDGRWIECFDCFNFGYLD